MEKICGSNMLVSNGNPFFYKNNFAKYHGVSSNCIVSSSFSFKSKVTIGIPTYKRPDLLALAIESALTQVEYFEYDILILDNDPTRNCATEKLIQKYDDPRISYFKNDRNIGMSGNWNRLFELARAEYLVMLHDDDLLLPKYLIKMMGVVENHKSVTFLKPAFSIIRGEATVMDIDLPTSRKNLTRLHWFSFYNGNILGAPVGVLFNKSAFLNFGGFDEAYYPSIDLHFFCNYAKYADVWSYNDCLALYRYSENESLNLNTLNGFIEIDNLLTREILRSFKIPEFIIRSFLNYKVVETIRLYKDVVNQHFELDESRLNWIPYEDSLFGPTFAKALKGFNYFIRAGVQFKLFCKNFIRYFNG
jgi:glycosyltransferase involved in cell wall biosynthesis